jgi:hypothetical protein
MAGLFHDIASFAAVVAFVFAAAVMLPDLSAAAHGARPVIVADRGEG